MYLVFLDKKGKIRKPETWEELKEVFCNRWDNCSPCPYVGSISRTYGGRECNHPLCPYEHNLIKGGKENATMR